jgi:hypothetical protein
MMNKTSLVTAIVLVAALAAPSAMAQTSASYKLTESTINSGGDPGNGVILTSSHFHIKLDSAGDGLVGAGLGSASYHMSGGFVGSYPPPGEIMNVSLNGSTLQWDPEPSAGVYEVYRGPLSTLPGTFGTCFAGNVSAPMITDSSSPPTSQAYFYLITVRNRLAEEGVKGYQSNGTPEGNPSPCQ